MDVSGLKYLRKGKRTRQTDLAKTLGITQTYLSLLEHHRCNPSIKLLEDWCKELDCELRIIPKP